MLNAFALPGGFIGVHTGLVITSQSESELASVLGHEIGHVTQRHIARMIARQKESTAMAIGALLLAILAARAGGSSSGDLTQAAILGSQAAMVQQQLNFSREAEREADRVGFQTLVRGRVRRPRHGRLLRPHAVGHADLRGHGAGLPAHAPDDRRAHLRHAEPHAQPAVQAARRQPRVPADPGAPARAAGDDDAGLARRAGVLQRADQQPHDPRRVRGALRGRGRGAEAQPRRSRPAERARRQAPRAGLVRHSRQGRGGGPLRGRARRRRARRGGQARARTTPRVTRCPARRPTTTSTCC